jgi:hypothetical protein
VSKYEVLWLECLGTGSFAPGEVEAQSLLGPREAALADLEGDAALDVAVVNSSDGTVVWAPNTMPRDGNGNGVDDALDLASGLETDCNGNGMPDSCEVDQDPGADSDGNGVPDGCQPGGIVFCSAHPNATGRPGRLGITGSPLLADDTMTLHASDLPVGQPALVLMSRAADAQDGFGGGEGILCLGSPIHRLGPLEGFPLQVSDAAGQIEVSAGTAALPGPAVLSGEALHFQLWHREFHPATGQPRSNTTDAIRVMFR